MKINFKISVALILLIAVGFGCKKSYLDTNPTDSISKNEMFKTTSTAYTALNGLHSFMLSTNDYNNAHDNFGAKAVDLENDVMGIDMICQSAGGYDWFYPYYTYVGPSVANYRYTAQMWLFFYRVINNANAIIVNIDNAEGPQSEKDDIKGQALAYRAWAYLGLVQHYQHGYTSPGGPSLPGVPIYTEPTTPESKASGRGTLQDNYDMMYADCQEAIELLADAPSHAGDISNISLAVAKGIFCRVAMSKGDWNTAKTMAADALAGYPLMTKTQGTNGLNSNANPEWMWGSNYTSEQYAANSIVSFISFVDQDCAGYASVGATRKITKSLYDTISSTDWRKGWWDSATHLQNKFHSQDPAGFVCDYYYMRAAEMYLNLAEAQYRLGDEAGAQQTLEDLVSTRDPNYTAPASGPALLAAILLQRRIELWGDGFGYTDIVRMGIPLDRSTDAGDHQQGVARVTYLPANSPLFLWKIPSQELDTNPNIGPEDQNP